jgi:Fe-S-cluster-containing dehydrogenase component/DMSO reductase anchor subunit
MQVETAGSVFLPLLARVSTGDSRFLLASSAPVETGAVEQSARMPSRRPGAGEQYRFHVDMRKCIGCKCCVVACNEQNGNPAAINWRRVGEIEGGFFPNAHRSYVSMSCNHCLNPTCLSGCPVDAFKQDGATGIVLHSADACIGCQYCTWNCSYGVPQYNPERGVVGKCDMCHGRLALGQAPACVSACPSGAIQIEIVNVESWRRTVARAAPVGGAPTADASIATTRLTLPATLTPDARPTDITTPTASEPHWSLILMTVLTQLSVGALTTVWLSELLSRSRHSVAAALSSLAVGLVAFAAATLHLGRPIYAYRAVKMWRRSWLSREVLLFAAFSVVACAYAAALWRGVAGAGVIGAVTALLGATGVTASACIYRVPSRPSWNTPFTLVQFNLTAATLGPLFAAAAGVGNPRWLAVVTTIAASVAFVVLALRFFRLSASPVAELQASARLLATVLRPRLVARGVLLAAGAIALPLFTSNQAALVVSLLLATAAEILGRYLFFVSAVPKHMTAPYLGTEAA